MRVTIAGVEWRRAKPPSGLDWTPFLLFFSISGNEAGQRRRREREFEAQHYPHRVTLTLAGEVLAPGSYRVNPRWPGKAPLQAEADEVNLSPWQLDARQHLAGQLTVTGQAELARWLAAGLRELELTPADALSSPL